MKKIVVILIFAFLAIYLFASNMAAVISSNSAEFECSYSNLNQHYCTCLNDKINNCSTNCGRGMIFYNGDELDEISSHRYNTSNPSFVFSDYEDDIESSTIMISSSRYDSYSGDDRPYLPLVWESRTDNKTYSISGSENFDDTDLWDILEADSSGEWIDDAIDHLHLNDDNEAITGDSDICNMELLFYIIIKNIEANRNILAGLEQAVYWLNTYDDTEDNYYRFIFSDGNNLYLYGKGYINYCGIYWDEVIRNTGGILDDQEAYAALTHTSAPNFNISTTDYQTLQNQVANFELVVLPSSGSVSIHQNFGNPDTMYIPKVDYLIGNGVNWKCFPVDWSGYDADDQIEETESYYVNMQQYIGYTDDLSWTELGSFDLSYTKGYKLELHNIAGLGLLCYDLEGVHVLEDREIPLTPGDRFWIPYFVHGTASPYVAFEDVIDYATKIQGRFWTMYRKRTTDSWNIAIDPGQSLLCSYGQMYDVTLTTGHPTVMDYYNTLGYDMLAEYVPQETEHFVYEEGFEYEAVLIDTIVSNDPIEEVAVFENGECIGASVFLGYPVFIRAFTSELNRSQDPLEFRIYTGGRSDNEMNYRVYDEDFSLYRDEEMYPRESIITRVCLGEKGEEMPVMDSDKIHTKQYPDPFNPETSIEYSIPEQGKITIDVYNIKGQKVRSLLSAYQTSGFHKVIWNGTDDNGRRTATGMYFYILKYKDQIVKEKMLMIK